jgi:capsular polysaccharide biosynthesis protein
MKYRVHFEASAAVGIGIEVEADSLEQAEKIANNLVKERQFDPEQVIEDLAPTEIEINAYAEAKGWPITHVEISPESFEVVDVFEPDLVTSEEEDDNGIRLIY